MRDQKSIGDDNTSEFAAAAVNSSEITLSPSWKEFEASLSRLTQWVRDEDWFEALSFDMALNPQVDNWVRDKINLFNQHLQGEALNRLIQELRAETEAELIRARHTHDSVHRWYRYRAAYARYAFVETVVEASSFSEEKIRSLTLELGANPLAKLAEVDRLKPSQLTKFTFQNHDLSSELLSLKTVTDYVILKHWQDNQNEYHHNVLFPEFREAREKFDSWRAKHAPEFNDFSARDALMAVLIVRQGFQHIHNIVRLSLANVGHILTRVVGGKTLGLCKLISSGRNVPEAWVLPAFSPIKRIPVPQGRNTAWAVRSSATVEDGEKTSFAGIFISELDISPAQLSSSIARVKASTESPRVKAYAEHFNTENLTWQFWFRSFSSQSMREYGWGAHLPTGASSG